MGAEEGAFPDTADNLENKTIALGKWVFNLGGVVHDFKDVLKRFQESMKHWSDRGPEDYEKNESDLRNLLASAVREGARRANVEIHGYNEDKGGSWKDKAVWVMGLLAVAAVSGGVAMFGKLSGLEAKVDSLQTQVTEVKRIVEPRYRGSP
jgi:hypothetical protein